MDAIFCQILTVICLSYGPTGPGIVPSNLGIGAMIIDAKLTIE